MTLFNKNNNITDPIKHYDSPFAFVTDLTEQTVKQLPKMTNKQLIEVTSLSISALEDYKDEMVWING